MKPNKKNKFEDLDSLIEEATVDCYNTEECRNGFLVSLQDNLPVPFKAKLREKEVTVKEIDGDDRVIKALVQDGSGTTYSMDVLDLKVSPEVEGSEWLAAYRKWENPN